jgi:hypothetical protein
MEKVDMHSSNKRIHGCLKGSGGGGGGRTVNSGLRPASFPDPKPTFVVVWNAIPWSLVEVYRSFG